MKSKSNTFLILFMTFSVFLNLAGGRFAVRYNLPLWADSFGTVLAAYVLGPVGGAAAGFAGNVISRILFQGRIAFFPVGISIGLIVGEFSRRGKFDSLFDVMAVSTLVAFVCVFFSSALNIFVYHGMTGNEWGDGVINFLYEHGFTSGTRYIIGQAYLEFLDKSVTLLLVYLLLRAKKSAEAWLSGKFPGIRLGIVLLLAFGIAAAHPVSARAENPLPTAFDAGDAGDAETAPAAADTPISPSASIDLYSYVQTIYNGTNGLMGGEANDIVQTDDGLLWVGTYAGLYRYNGSAFRLIDEFASVKNVNCLYTDEEGRLWVGTNDNGLSVLINGNLSSTLDESSGLPSNSVRSIVRGADGYYYIGTSGSMQVLTLNAGLSLTGRLERIVYAQSMSAADSGLVAAVTSGGDLFLLRGGKIVAHKTLDDTRGKFSCCLFDADGRLAVGTSGDMVLFYRLNGEDQPELTETMQFPDISNINRLYRTDEGLFFVCSDTGVSCALPDGSIERVHLNQFENSIDAMMMDYQGNLWFASSRLGLLRMSKSLFSDLYSSSNLEQRLVNSSALLDGELYAGTDTGLDIIHMEDRTPVYNKLTDLLDGVRIRCVLADSAGNLWVCTYGQGLLQVSPDGEIQSYDSSSGFCDWVRTAYESADGTIVVSGDAGIARIRDGEIRELLAIDSFSTAMVLSMLETSDGTLLAGTDGDGLAVLKDGRRIAHLTTTEGLSSGVILRIVESRAQGGYYLVTSNGICYMDQDNTVRLLDNFPYFNNYDVWQSENGRLFVLSSAGIFVVSEEELLSGETPLSYEMLDASTGLNVSLTVNSWNCLDDTGRLYLSTDKGVFAIDLDEYGYQQKHYRMMLSTVTMDGVQQTVERGEDILIPRTNMQLELSPELLNYTLDDPTVSYQLLGFDAEPYVVRYSEMNDPVYTNLPSGEYDFRMAVLDSSGEPIEMISFGLNKELAIQDHFWFRMYLFLVFGVFTAWMAFFLSRAVFQRQIELQKQKTEMANQTIMAIAKTVDVKDTNTSHHSIRVSEYAVKIAQEMGFSESECENLRKAALLHDIGKIGIPDRILNKPSRLTDEEYEIMKSHVVRGAEILKDFTSVEHVVEGALYHHERYDGRGYVSGLKGNEIPLYGRIIGVADAFDAMTANRVYRRGIDINVVLEEISRCKGTQFDPAIADILLKLVHDGTIVLAASAMEEADGAAVTEDTDTVKTDASADRNFATNASAEADKASGDGSEAAEAETHGTGMQYQSGSGHGTDGEAQA